MVKKCIVNDCETRNSSDEVTLHLFPENTEIKERWLKRISSETGQKIELEEDTVICSKHFSSDCFTTIEGISTLNSSAVPFNHKMENKNDSTNDEPSSKRIKIETPSDEVDGVYCHVSYCMNIGTDTSPSIIYHSFPKDLELAKKWKKCCENYDENDDDFEDCYICSDHFTSDDYTISPDGKKILKPTALPTIYEDVEMEECDGSDDDEASGDNKVNVSEKQYEIMVSFMEEHRSLVQAENSNNQKLWQKLINDLNARGPLIQNMKGWKKVWKNFKNDVEKKSSSITKIDKNETENDEAGPSKLYTFTDLEKRVIKLLQWENNDENDKSSKSKTENVLPDVIANNGGKSTTEDPKNDDTSSEQSDMVSSEEDDDYHSYSDDEDDTYDEEEERGTIEALEKVMELQQKYFKQMSKTLKVIANTFKRQCKIMQKGVELREKQFELEKKGFEEKQNYRQEKLRLMREELNIERASLELRLRHRVNGEE